MRHSIRLKISFMILASILCMVAAVIMMNTLFLDKFYMRDKERAFSSTYQVVNTYLENYNGGSITSEQLSQGLESITRTKGISIMLLNSDWSIVYASMRDVEEFMNRLRVSLFTKILSGQVSEENEELLPVIITDNYTVYEIYNSKMNDTYLELVGNTTDGKVLYMTQSVKSIQDNVDISNRFIIYVGIIIAVIATVVAFVMGNVIAKPVKELSRIAERMSELDFNVAYERDDKSEIGVLGNSMNKLSAKLESTISELKSANVELLKDIETKEQMDEMRKEFLSNVSHELKTPIALIQGYAEGLKEGISDDPESTEFYCDVIIDEAARMNGMVKQLLTLNQMEFGSGQLEIERFNLTEVIDGVIARNKLPAQQQEIAITVNAPEQVWVWADEYKIEEVLTNYLTNAIHYCEGEKNIEISVTADDKTARVGVFNTGNPIPDDELDNIWVKFYKVDKARTREYGGSGIGLSIVKAVMEQHNQKFGVLNKENGVEFWFELDTGA